MNPFLKDYVVDDNALDNLKWLTRSWWYFENFNNVLASATNEWWLENPSTPNWISSTRLNNLPWFPSNPDKWTFLEINADWELWIWLENDDWTREEFQLETFAWSNMNIETIFYQDKWWTSMDFCILPKGAPSSVKFKYTVFEKILVGLDKWETDITVEFNDLSKDDPNFISDFADNLKNNVFWWNTNWVVDFLDQVGTTYDNIDEALEAAFNILKPKIRFEKTWNTRPE
jgi:hypothetical protein